MVLLAFAIGYIDDVTGPQPYHYEDTVVIVDKKYQCPKHCKVSHYHSVFYEGYGMTVDKNELGEKYKEKKNKKKK
tara:strand:+ start:266 stop:490 length:225 start_codon:yes stop_codon:yes gene_type:complete